MTKQEYQEQLHKESQKYIDEIKKKIEEKDMDKKYYCEYKFDKGMTIQTAGESELKSRCSFEKKRNTIGSLTLYPTLQDCKDSLKTYSKKVTFEGAII